MMDIDLVQYMDLLSKTFYKISEKEWTKKEKAKNINEFNEGRDRYGLNIMNQNWLLHQYKYADLFANTYLKYVSILVNKLEIIIYRVKKVKIWMI